MTNEQYIKSLSRKDLASILIQEGYRENWDYDYDENPFFWSCKTYLVTSDGLEFDEYDYEAALEHECWWLQQEAVACCREKLD